MDDDDDDDDGHVVSHLSDYDFGMDIKTYCIDMTFVDD